MAPSIIDSANEWQRRVKANRLAPRDMTVADQLGTNTLGAGSEVPMPQNRQLMGGMTDAQLQSELVSGVPQQTAMAGGNVRMGMQPAAAQPMQPAANMVASQPGAGQVATAQREFGVTGGNVLSRGQMISSMLYQMAPEHIQRATAAYRLRTMSSADKSKELAQRALETDMGLRNQQGFSLRTPLGPSLEDGAMAATPEIQMVHRNARTDFMREFSDMMSTADKTKWRTMEDYEAAVAGLPSVQKYGDMISGTVFNAARKFAGPELRAKFEANDKNAESFQQWAIRNTQNDFNADGIPDTFAEVWTASQQGDPAARNIMRLWEDDPDAEKYEAIGDKIQRKQPGAAERLTMAQRETDMQTAQARKAVEESGGTMEMAPPPGAQLTPEAMLGRKQTLAAQQIEFDRKRSQEWIAKQPEPSKWIVDVNGQPKEVKKAEGEDFAQFFGTKAPKDETTMRRVYQEMSKLWSEAEFGTEKTPPPFTTLAERYPGVTDETEAQERWRADEQKKAAALYRAKSKAYDFNAWQLTGDQPAQPGRAIPAAAPSAAATITEGTIIVGPNGQRMVLRNNKWEPM